MIHLSRIGFAVLLMLSSLSFAQQQSSTQASDQPVIQVGDRVITESEFQRDFERAMRSLAARQGIPFNEQTRALFNRFREDFLMQLANQEALLCEAQNRGITVTDEEVESRVQEVRDRLGGEEAFQQGLTEAGFADEAEFRDFVRENETIARTIEELRQDVTVTDEDIQQFYEENQDRFRTQEGVAPLEDVRDQIEQQLEFEALNERLGELREQCAVEVFPGNLSEIDEGMHEGQTGTMQQPTDTEVEEGEATEEGEDIEEEEDAEEGGG